MAGVVKVEGIPQPKAGLMVGRDTPVQVLEDPNPYVSRGGLKLRGALEAFGLRPNGWICLDVGSSTGGFTDCLLQHGAAHIYAVDVGRNVIDPTLRSDSRITVIEGINARYFDLKLIPHPVDLLTMDVSFISVTRVLPAVLPTLKKSGHAVILVKPQFELRPADNRKGVVRDAALQQEAVQKVRTHAEGLGLFCKDQVESSLRGPKGNREFFLHFLRP